MFRAVENGVRHDAAHRSAEDPFFLSVPNLHVGGQSHRIRAQVCIQEGNSNLDAMRHGGPVHFLEERVREEDRAVGVEQPLNGIQVLQPLGELSISGEWVEALHDSPDVTGQDARGRSLEALRR